jgi:hypothetical protein
MTEPQHEGNPFLAVAYMAQTLDGGLPDDERAIALLGLHLTGTSFTDFADMAANAGDEELAWRYFDQFETIAGLIDDEGDDGPEFRRVERDDGEEESE